MDYSEDYEEPELPPIALNARTLKLLGVDGNMITAGVIATVSAQIMRKSADHIKTLIEEQIQDAIGAQINAIVLEILTQTYTPHSKYGDIEGEPTTIRREFEKAVAAWWAQKVEPDGAPANYSYSGEPRSSWIAKKAIKELLDTELKDKMTGLVRNSRAALKAGVTAALADAVEKMWK